MAALWTVCSVSIHTHVELETGMGNEFFPAQIDTSKFMTLHMAGSAKVTSFKCRNSAQS